jgi:hypothetical protein
VSGISHTIAKAIVREINNPESFFIGCLFI